jgi:glycosyltransferase involved in cell wall biosynthesis
MHVLYVHPNFPAQFGHIAARLVDKPGWKVTFATTTAGPDSGGIQRVVYKPAGGATEANHFCSRTFENTIWNCDGVYQALKARPDLKPDLIVGHSGFGSTLFLRELYGSTPIINFFEFYYSTGGPDSDLGFRHDLGWPVSDAHKHRARARNAMILLDLQNCDAAYVPTKFQQSRFPAEYQPKLNVIFDGVDRSLYHSQQDALRPKVGNRPSRVFAGTTIGPTTRIVTYVSRGFETMRGFDIFMKSAQRIIEQYPDVVFFVVGSDRICYGGDDTHLGGEKSFKNWVLARGKYDMEKIKFTGLLPPTELARLLAMTDLHIYLTAPFVLSWSMMNAMSCGAVVLGSRTSPVQEMIRDGENGLLADFFDPEEFAGSAIAILRDPDAFRPLGTAAEEMIAQQYSLDAVLPRMVEFYESVISGTARKL